ncbi:MAG: GAF domain-containing SpoIIE family protein phosphatase [Capsulimonas sp.]|uniref:PP2C family protein-serine/threonine phosphatase n=1 Tax=Capsulimonas sp. TaxID=2494211 RepID=UPI003264DA92
MQAPKPPNEAERLAALARYEILDASPEEEFEEITRLAARMCNAPIALISLVDHARQWFLSEVGLGVTETPLSMSMCAHAILEPDVLVIPDTRADSRFSDNPLVTGDPHVRFYAGALLETDDGHALGTLCILDYKTRELTEEQKDILRMLSNQVMKQLELRRMVRQQEQVIAQKEEARAMLDTAYAHEKQITETLQRSLLIDIDDRVFPGLDVAALYEAAWSEADVGGDFYDVFQLSPDEVALVMGDVAGKGLGAAARTAEVKYALRAFLQEYPDPARTLTRLNNFICQFHDYAVEDDPRFVALLLGVINVRTGETTLAFAGAEPPTLLRCDGAIELVYGIGYPLGIIAGGEYEMTTIHLGPGDTLMMATDGLTESRQGDKFLGQDGLANLATQARDADTLKGLGQKIVDQVKEFAGGSMRDDMCLLLARRSDA